MILTLGLGLLALIALAVLVKTYADVGLGALCKYSVRLFSSGLAIGSSYLILPIALKVFKEHFSIRRDVADLGLALGTSLNRCGSVMGVLVVSYVAARFTGTYFSSADMFLMAVPVALVAFGSPGVQGGTLFVTMSLILDVIAPSDVNKFTGVAFAIFIGGTTFIQAAVNTVASSYVTLLIGYGKRL
jgi:Na+/H+-dicarboxylate symporter